MSNRIREIELNVSNVCDAHCYCCDHCRGSGNVKLMADDVWDAIIDQLQDISFDTIQTSGNGDALLHPHFLVYMEELRAEFPDKKIHFYSSFLNMTPEVTDQIVEEGYFDDVFTRLDSLDSGILDRSTKVNGFTILENITYFLRKERTVPLNIGYSSIPQYYKKCADTLQHLPLNAVFSVEEVVEMHDEFLEIGQWVSEMGAQGPVHTMRINQSLWAERHHPDTPIDLSVPCPKLPLLNDIIWICPNGDVDVCGYDDSQHELVYGNILNKHMLAIWNSAARMELLEKIELGKITDYPCNARQCCVMREDDV